MNAKNLFVIDFSKSSIVASATTLKKARKPESPEYRVLTELLCVHPNFCVIEKDIQKKPGKKTYKGLTFQTMLDYIRTQTNSEDKIKAYNAVRRIAKVKGCEYPLTKKWFLKTYPDYKETDITAQEIGALLQEQEKAQILQLPMPASANVVGRDA